MRNFITAGVALLFLVSVTVCFAGPKIPSLVGAWSAKAEGGVLVRGEKTGKTTHWENKQQTALGAEIIITEQKDRVIYGVFTSKKAKENFIAVIGTDNKLYFADEDGFLDGKIINDDTIEVIYRHVTPTDTVVSIGVWTRKK